MIFSNCLLRIKAHMHMFHFLISYPELKFSDLIIRSEIQLRVANGTDSIQNFRPEQKKDDQSKPSEIDESKLKCNRNIGIPCKDSSQTFSITRAVFGDVELTYNNRKERKTFLGKGGFGEVKHAIFYGQESAVKFFNTDISPLQNKDHVINTEDIAKARTIDSVREIEASINLNAKWFPRFNGIGFRMDNNVKPIL